MNNQQNCEYYIYIYCIQSNIAGNMMIKPFCLPTKWNNQRWETPQKKKLQNENWDFEVKVLTPENADTSNGIGKQQRYGVWARQVVIKPDQKIGI